LSVNFLFPEIKFKSLNLFSIYKIMLLKIYQK
jgi:hypothetical protein